MALPPDDWPHRNASRAVRVGPIDWHVQVMGSGPVLLLLHGAGGGNQSWRGLMPLLADDFTVVAPDLPGQGYSRVQGRHDFGLDQMATDLGALLEDQNWSPAALIGHSAGGVIALRMAEVANVPCPVVGINAALGEFPGMAGWLFPAMAKVMAINPFFSWAFTRISASETQINQLLKTTGSRVDPEMLKQYLRLAQDRDHVAGTLSMMADWKLRPLLSRLPMIDAPALLLVGSQDGTVPPATSRDAARALPSGAVRLLSGLGHLAHEEAPEGIAQEIRDFLGYQGVLRK